MKKTVQTLMTAAMFAMAMGNLSAGTTEFANAMDYNPASEDVQGVYGPPVAETTDVVTTTTDTIPVPVYGPPVSWTESTKTTNTTTQTTKTTNYQTGTHTTTIVPDTKTTNYSTDNQTTMSTAIPEPVYGPPISWTTSAETNLTTKTTTSYGIGTQTTMPTTIPETVYGPPIAWLGDINRDNRVDVFDMIELKQAYFNGKYDSNADVNMDGEIGVADLVMLQDYLLGKVDSFYKPIPEPQPTTTSLNTSYINTQSTTKTTEPVPQPEYGAPIAFE